jgi:predicted nucleic acid-binding protein
LIDSNAIIDFCNGKLPLTGKDLLLTVQPEISIITNIELFASKDISEQEQAVLRKFVSLALIHTVNSEIVEPAIFIRQNHKIKLPDAIIAATALTYNLTLITRNIKDYRNIEGLSLVDPHRA